MPTSTVEDYLKCILVHELRAPDRLVTMGEVATGLQVAPGTVTAMVKTLAESGLVDYEPYAGVRLTASGRNLGSHVLRRHRLLELFLVQVLGMDWSEVHGEAEQLEHVVSDRVLERIDDMLGRPSVDPHGDPIPTAQGVVVELDRPTLVNCPLQVEVRVARVSDQTPEFLQLLERCQLVPGNRLQVLERDDFAETVALQLPDGERLSLGSRAAAKVQVEPVAGE